MSAWYRRAALSDHWAARFLRSLHRLQYTFSLPIPGAVAKPFVYFFLFLRSAYFFLFRVFLAEPFFRTYCHRVGKNFHTGAHLHWVIGRGRILIGDNVIIDGKCHFFFAVRYAEQPTLSIGDNSGIGHSCAFTVGREILIGRNCRVGGGVVFFDTPGHPNDPEARRAGRPATPDDVRAIIIGDNVWIGSDVIIFPGVTIGDNSIVAYGSVVMSSVPENVVVAGNPARQIAKIPAPAKTPVADGATT
jgi:acetyltransferase-like isoleucine patch superfamily enzyme